MTSSPNSLPVTAPKRRRIAVCVSGEFRHVHHRTPEHQLRHLKAFLSGVDCDVYVHGWNTSSEALILAELAPKAVRFEPRPDLSRLADQIRWTEPNIKPGRDHGSLSMFYGISGCFDLVEQSGVAYDLVVRIRPDLRIEQSLRQIIAGIDAAGWLPDAIYMPPLFHSKGINDQFAIGPTAAMRIYSATYGYVARNVRDLFFNPESILLRHLLEQGQRLAILPISYALMRGIPFRINTVHEATHRQHNVWWSRTDWLPPYQNVTAYFADKLAAMHDAMGDDMPYLLYLRVPEAGRKDRNVILRTRATDNDPARQTLFLFRRWGLWRIFPGILTNVGAVQEAARAAHMFILSKKGGVVASEWRLDHGQLVNARVETGPADHHPKARSLGVRMDVVFWSERLDQRLRRWLGLTSSLFFHPC